MAAQDQRQNAMLVDQFLVDGANNVDIDLDGIQVEQGNAKFVRGGHGDGAGLGKILVNEISDERELLVLGGFRRLDELFLGDQSVLHQPPGQASQGCLCYRHCHAVT